MKRLSNLMLVAAFISTIFYAASYPYIYAETLKVIPQVYISIEQIICCLGTVVFCKLWNKYSDKLFRYYDLFLWLEIIADSGLFAYVLISWNLSFYFLLNVIIYSTITSNLVRGGTKMRAKVNPTEKLREIYDNNNNIVNSVATLMGASLAIFYQVSLKILFVLALIGNIVDNFFYLYIYKELRRIDDDKQRKTA